MSYEALKVKPLLKDAALYVALLPVLLPLLPDDVKQYVVENRASLYTLAAVIAGHMGIRLVGAHGAGKLAVAEATAPVAEPAAIVETDEPEDVETAADDDLADDNAEAARLAAELGINDSGDPEVPA